MKTIIYFLEEQNKYVPEKIISSLSDKQINGGWTIPTKMFFNLQKDQVKGDVFSVNLKNHTVYFKVKNMSDQTYADISDYTNMKCDICKISYEGDTKQFYKISRMTEKNLENNEEDKNIKKTVKVCSYGCFCIFDILTEELKEIPTEDICINNVIKNKIQELDDLKEITKGKAKLKELNENTEEFASKLEAIQKIIAGEDVVF